MTVFPILSHLKIIVCFLENKFLRLKNLMHYFYPKAIQFSPNIFIRFRFIYDKTSLLTFLVLYTSKFLENLHCFLSLTAQSGKGKQCLK